LALLLKIDGLYGYRYEGMPAREGESVGGHSINQDIEDFHEIGHIL